MNFIVKFNINCCNYTTPNYNFNINSGELLRKNINYSN